MSEDNTLAPPEEPLVPPGPVAVVEPDKAAERVPLPADMKVKLDDQVGKFIQEVTSLDVHGTEFRGRVDSISSMGNAEMTQAASVSNRMLERPVRTMKDGAFDKSSPISKGLIDLRTTVEKLDPSRQGDLLSMHRILGVIPFGNKLRNYFESYQSAQTHLKSIMDSLYHGRDELQRDNAAIEQEKQQMWGIMQRVQQYIYLGKNLDAALEARIKAIDATDPERAKVLREEIQFPTRQKVMDLLTQMAVCIQGYMALDLVKKNNLELVKGVDRATTTTISALRTAVVVAQALTNEKLVLDQITALNTTTGNMIEGTASLLRQQTGQIYAQAASSTVNLQQLQKAFDNIYATMDMVSDFKVKALDSMQQTVDTLSVEVDKAKGYLDRTRQGVVQESVAQLPAGKDDGVVQLLG